MTSAVLGKLSQASGWFGWSGRKAPSMSAASLEDKQQRTLNLKMRYLFFNYLFFLIG